MHVGMTTFFQNIGHTMSDAAVYVHEMSMADLAELQVWGTPDQVFNKLAEHQRLADSGGVIGAFSYGGMPHDAAKRNMTLFAHSVLPRLQRIEAGCEIGSPRPLTVKVG